jgi:DNA polymerase-3 subunit delta'
MSSKKSIQPEKVNDREIITRELLPWHRDHWMLLQDRLSSQKLPHALILNGRDGLGKSSFAFLFAKSIFCREANQQFENDYHKNDFPYRPCGNCKNCELINASSHPDLMIIKKDDEGRAIKVDQIREIADFIGKTSQMGGYKIVIVREADSMNINAANALLKTLEEPIGKSILMLTVERLGVLPATVKSRCQILNFRVPNNQDSSKWLKSYSNDQEYNFDLALHLAKGAPLKALASMNNGTFAFRESIFNDFVEFSSGKLSFTDVSERWNKHDILMILDYLISWTADLIRLKSDSSNLRNIYYYDFLKNCNADINSIFHYYDSLCDAEKTLKRGIALNTAILLETLLLEWENVIN